MKYFIDKYIRKAKFEYVRTQGFTSGTVTCFILWTPPYFAELEEQLMSLPHNLQMKIVFDKMCASKVIRTSYHSRFLFMEVALAPFIVKVERSRIGCIKEYLDPYDVQMNSLQTEHVQHGGCTSWLNACGKNDLRLHIRLLQFLVEQASLPVKHTETNRCIPA